ncbi:CPBP family intramembrane glutamic endopeptidase [Marinagarivorans algicola]|uniref:CPBP family intramembrane glutamic endopeptidase n=1 Tax=Marinagarivorans algicola TaxID=1513270 RepID=UPI00138F24E3|nr:CPBP family intramembrane glutamic endopeptidase [Marinagarivorans algicola]
MSIIVVATTLMIIVKSPNIQVLSGMWAQAHYESLLMYGVVPCLLLVILGHHKLDALALGIGDWRFWLPASALYLAAAIPIMLIGANDQALNEYYQKTNVNWLRHVSTTLIYLLGWEYFFRGFLLAGLRKNLKEGAILLQMIPFTLLHLGKPDIEILSCILSGLIWGYICYRSRSFWPAFLMHAIVNFTMLFVANT